MLQDLASSKDAARILKVQTVIDCMPRRCHCACIITMTCCCDFTILFIVMQIKLQSGETTTISQPATATLMHVLGVVCHKRQLEPSRHGLRREKVGRRRACNVQRRAGQDGKQFSAVELETTTVAMLGVNELTLVDLPAPLRLGRCMPVHCAAVLQWRGWWLTCAAQCGEPCAGPA